MCSSSHRTLFSRLVRTRASAGPQSSHRGLDAVLRQWTAGERFGSSNELASLNRAMSPLECRYASALHGVSPTDRGDYDEYEESAVVLLATVM